MTIRLTNPELQWVKNEYEAGRTIQEIATDTGMSISNTKRALAETGLLSLSWYKTRNELDMVNYLRTRGITNLNQLKQVME